MASLDIVTKYRSLDVGVTGQAVRTEPCGLTFMGAFNKHATDDRFLKLYDKASAASEADTPVMTIGIAAKVWTVISRTKGREIPFDLGLSIRATTGIADNDTGAPTANDVSINIGTTLNYAGGWGF